MSSSAAGRRHYFHEVRPMQRREAIRLIGGAVSLGLARFGHSMCAAEPPQTGLGIVVYALGLQRQKRKNQDPNDDLFEPFTFLKYCHQLGAGGIQVPLGRLAPTACEQLREKAQSCGMFVEGIVDPPFRDEDLDRFEAEIRAASQAGVKVVRTVIIPGRRYERFKSLEEFRQFSQRGQQALERAVPVVERHRVRLAVENHKDQRIDERLALLRHVESQYIGACVDMGNSLSLLEEPLAVVEALAPYAFSAHLKDQALREYADGFLLADAALGEGCLDLRKMVAILRRAQPGVQFSLETITRDPLPVPCLNPDYWATFPGLPASDLARTLRLVRSQAPDKLPQVSSLPLEKQADLELATVRQCLTYARTELGL